ncbi:MULTISPECIES: transcription termination factor NusA [unclassified Gemella]|uniref:transcription termination factor NusA n=1 Tax=unclassified Gemella TaxID=2624949 RepID=UPI001073DEB8|nr:MULTISPECIES: transcription termination factor NusA [unclassified Gemella]MBF0710071.1 transcription termination/antitermination protein NusA [Gemella sp. GL1.1]MBF0746150.1 transcription termination/antitermination protein NusA [Gemella sp. 19428wG2_WT2a]NYS27415.1 transcription termination/antitermination protein NusA [Gemella sp. GL1]TFU60436.1 transcription termination/antitermination protein NusA [Gemella sp. WT2a]
MSKALLKAIEVIETEKGISREILFEAIEVALLSAYRKNFNSSKNVTVDFNRTTGKYIFKISKEVVEEVYDNRIEISLEEALKINPAYEIGDLYIVEDIPEEFGRVGAQAAKQALMQRLRDAEKEVLYNEYLEYEGEIRSGYIDRIDSRYVYVKLGKIEAILGESERVLGEEYIPQTPIKVYIAKVENPAKGSRPHVLASRSHPDFIKRLFEQEVPEIYDGVVEIKSVSREAGERTKIAVYSDNNNIDAVGSCVGPSGSRVSTILKELNGEKIDIIPWDKDIEKFIINSLSPAKVDSITISEEEKIANVIVNPGQLSLAIGKKGQNVRLAAKLTGWKIDIKTEEALIEE